MKRTLILILLFTLTNLVGQTFSLTANQFAKGQTYTSWRIMYELGSHTLMLEPSCKLTLDSIHKFLTDNPAISIEIGVHTWARGKAIENLKLSQQRADEIKRFLLEQNIDSARIVSKGYGDTKPYLTKEQEETRSKRCKCEPGPNCHIGNARMTIIILDIL